MREVNDNTTISEIKEIINEFEKIGINIIFQQGGDFINFNTFDIKQNMMDFNGKLDQIYNTLELYKEKNKFKILRKNIENLIEHESILEEVTEILKEKGVLK